MNQVNISRILAIALTSRGFGYAVLEGKDSLVVQGTRGVDGDKNEGSLGQIEKMIARFRPDVLVLYDVNAKGTYRHKRIKALHKKVMRMASARKLKTKTVSAIAVRETLVGVPKATKHEMAELLAKRFLELTPHLPPKRREWESEDRRMDMFDAVALGISLSLEMAGN